MEVGGEMHIPSIKGGKGGRGSALPLLWERKTKVWERQMFSYEEGKKEGSFLMKAWPGTWERAERLSE